MSGMRTIYIIKWTGVRGSSFFTAHQNPKNAVVYKAKYKGKRFTSTPGDLMKMMIPKAEYNKFIEKIGSDLGIKIRLSIS